MIVRVCLRREPVHSLGAERWSSLCLGRERRVRLPRLYAFGRLEPSILDGDPSIFIEDVINPRDALLALHSLRTMVDLVSNIVV